VIKNFKIFNVFNKRNRKWGIKFQNEFLDIKGMDRSQNFMLKEIDVRLTNKGRLWIKISFILQTSAHVYAMRNRIVLS